MRNDLCPACGRDGAQIESPIERRAAQVISCPRCGKFGMDEDVLEIIRVRYSDERHRLSYSLRLASDRNQAMTVATVDVLSLIQSAPKYNGFSEGVDLFLLHLSTKARRYMTQIEINPALDYTKVPVKDDSVYSDLHGSATAMGFIDADTRRITVDRWRRIEELRTSSRSHRQAFVAMWFDDGTNDAWVNGLVPGIERSQYSRAFRIDSKEHNNKIDDEIVAEIRRSGLLVADFTGHRGGIYFEAGFAQGLGIPVIWTCNEADISTAHFDTRQYSHIVWRTPTELAMALDRRIRATVLPAGFARAI